MVNVPVWLSGVRPPGMNLFVSQQEMKHLSALRLLIPHKNPMAQSSGESWELLECLWVNYYLYSPLQRGRKAASLSSDCTDWQPEGSGWSFQEHREQLTNNKPRNVLSQEWSYECVACQVLRNCPLKQHSGTLNIEIGYVRSFGTGICGDCKLSCVRTGTEPGSSVRIRVL